MALGAGLLGLQRAGDGGLCALLQRVDLLVTAQCVAPMPVDHEVACRAVEQGADVPGHGAGVPECQHVCVAFLRQVGGRLAIVHEPGQKVEQFAVVVFDHDARAHATSHASQRGRHASTSATASAAAPSDITQTSTAIDT